MSDFIVKGKVTKRRLSRQEQASQEEGCPMELEAIAPMQDSDVDP